MVVVFCGKKVFFQMDKQIIQAYDHYDNLKQRRRKKIDQSCANKKKQKKVAKKEIETRLVMTGFKVDVCHQFLKYSMLK